MGMLNDLYVDSAVSTTEHTRCGGCQPGVQSWREALGSSCGQELPDLPCVGGPAHELAMKTQVRAGQLMTPSPGWCTPEDPLEIAARLMVRHECGAIPVVDDPHGCRPTGMITDRDIVVRMVAVGRNTAEALVRDAMTHRAITAHMDATFQECAAAMRVNRVRRVMVVDDRGRLAGVVTDGDLARACRSDPDLEHHLAMMVEDVSDPEAATPAASAVVSGGAALSRPDHPL